MASPLPTHLELVTTYRHLLRHLLHAVQYAKPARFIVQDRLRATFRDSAPGDFHAANIERTLEFLRGATQVRGLEHRILKNLVHVRWAQGKQSRGKGRPDVLPLKQAADARYDQTLERLNASMGLCIR